MSTILVDLPFNSFWSTAKSVRPSANGTTTSPSTMAEPASISAASADFAEALVRLSAAAGKDPASLDVNLDAVAVELNLVNQRAPWGTLSIDDAKAGSMKPGWGALTPRTFLRRPDTAKAPHSPKTQPGYAETLRGAEPSLSFVHCAMTTGATNGYGKKEDGARSQPGPHPGRWWTGL